MLGSTILHVAIGVVAGPTRAPIARGARPVRDLVTTAGGRLLTPHARQPANPKPEFLQRAPSARTFSGGSATRGEELHAHKTV